MRKRLIFSNSAYKSVHGHTKNINCMTVHKASNTVVTADYDGNVCSWDASSGEGKMFGGKVSYKYSFALTFRFQGHGSQITALANDNLDGLISVGFDNKIRITSLK